MNCPKCTGNLLAETYNHNIAIYRCEACAGLWCKPDALKNMKEVWMAEAVLDIGDPKIGKTLNEIDDISCPEGHGKMEKKTDPQQRHIWFEACITCGGIFLDAGEFTDLKYDTPLDRVRDLIKGPRPSE